MDPEPGVRVKGITIGDQGPFVIEVDEVSRTVSDYYRIRQAVAVAVESDHEADDLAFVIDAPAGMKMPVVINVDNRPRLEMLDVAWPWVALMPRV